MSTRFLLACLHTDTLQDKVTPKAIKLALVGLSKGSGALNHAYDEVLERIQSQLPGQEELAKQVLTWVTFANRPLTTIELCCALAVEPGSSNLDPDNLPDIEDLLSVCAGLVVIDQESAIVRLVHYTTQDYFERNKDRWIPGAQLSIATACLTYVCFDAFRVGMCHCFVDWQQRLRKNALLIYAAHYWLQYAKEFETELSHLICTFIRDENLVATIKEAQITSLHWSIDGVTRDTFGTSIYRAARYGLTKVLKDPLQETKDEIVAAVNEIDNRDRVPIVIAALHGHDQTVELLLENGADTEARDSSEGGGTALYYASEFGNTHVVKLLLEHGARASIWDADGCSALHTAAANGFEQIVKLLLDKGADVGVGENEFSALQSAAELGHERIVMMLLTAGADPNALDATKETTLLTATRYGNGHIVKLLLDAGADPNVVGVAGTALWLAADWHFSSTVELLLEANAEPSIQENNDGETYWTEDERTMELLFSAGLSTNSRLYKLALNQAIDDEDDALVSRLLKAGVTDGI